jgi:hypothetical protein
MAGKHEFKIFFKLSMDNFEYMGDGAVSLGPFGTAAIQKKTAIITHMMTRR